MISTVQSLREINFEIDDEWVAHFMLAGLPEFYAPTIMTLQNQGKALDLEDIIQPGGDEPSALVSHSVEL